MRSTTPFSPSAFGCCTVACGVRRHLRQPQHSRRAARRGNSRGQQARDQTDAFGGATRRQPATRLRHHDAARCEAAFSTRSGQARVHRRRSEPAVGSRHDNAVAESVFASLDYELMERRSFKAKTEARLAVFTWIETWDNPRRRHSAHGRISPVNSKGCTPTSFTDSQASNTGCPPPACAWLAPRRPWTTLHGCSSRLEDQVINRP